MPEITNKSEWTFQNALSLGYLFLLILGIIRDSIYYGYLGINIFYYSDLLDVLLSPIAYMSKSLLLPAIIVCLLGFTYVITVYLPKYKERNPAAKWIKYFVKDTVEHKEEDLMKSMLTISAIMIASFFLGSGIGAGQKNKVKIMDGNIKVDRVLTFMDDKRLDVDLVGQNRQFLFYVKEGSKSVTVTPISGNIRSIERLRE